MAVFLQFSLFYLTAGCKVWLEIARLTAVALVRSVDAIVVSVAKLVPRDAAAVSAGEFARSTRCCEKEKNTLAETNTSNTLFQELTLFWRRTVPLVGVIPAVVPPVTARSPVEAGAVVALEVGRVADRN